MVKLLMHLLIVAINYMLDYVLENALDYGLYALDYA
jgi:hypothetical protein